MQPFLTPIPPLAETSVLAKGFTVVRYALAILRVSELARLFLPFFPSSFVPLLAFQTIPVLLCSLLYLLTVEGVLGILVSPRLPPFPRRLHLLSSHALPPLLQKLAQLHHLQRPLAGVFTSIWTRLVLLMLGAFRFDVKYSASSSRG